MPITLNHVSFTYAQGTPFETSALEDINLTIEDGQFIGIMGHTGCGKSTMIQLIVGLMAPTSGQILLDGKDINQKSYDRDELRQKVGIVFQNPEYQLFETTIERDVAFGLKHSGLHKAEIAERVKLALEMVGFSFDKVRTLSPLSLSGGEKRKVAIAGVLAARPRILIFDEPIAGLDPLGCEEFLKLVDDLNVSGVTILMISHNADALAEHAQRILVLEHSKLIMDGNVKIVFSEADILSEKQLCISQSREIAYMLQKRGIDIPQDIIKYEELLPFLIALGKGGLQR